MSTNQTRPKLVRRTDNKIIAGVASGIADHFGVDPILVRVAFVLLSFAGAIGFVAYAAAWALIPRAGETRSLAESAIDKVGGKTGGDRDNTWIWIIVLAIAGVLILANLGHMWSGGGIVWALILMGAGTWLYLQDLNARKPDRRPPAAAAPLAIRPDTSPAVTDSGNPPAPAAEAVAADTIVVAPTGTPPTQVDPFTAETPPAGTVPSDVDPVSAETPPEDPATPEPVDPPAATAIPLGRPAPTITQPLPVTEHEVTRAEVVKPRKRRSRLGRHTLAAALIFVGVAALLENMGNIDLAPIQYGGLVLATLGGGLLIGTFWGRARGLIVLGILIIPLLVIAGFYTRWFDVPPTDAAGDRNIAPASVNDLDTSYRLGAGSMNLDLNRMTWGSDPVTVEASVGFGEINVSVPQGVEVEVRGRSSVGAVSLLDESRAGFGIDYNKLDGGAAGAPRLTLDLRTFMGQVEVVRSRIPAREL